MTRYDQAAIVVALDMALDLLDCVARAAAEEVQAEEVDAIKALVDGLLTSALLEESEIVLSRGANFE